jgi:very-short-patch-repair endonuclease
LEPGYRASRRMVAHLELCRRLRMDSTDAEQLLWRLLRGRQAGGAKFRRQHEHGPYILDFFCAEYALCVEVDGSQHLSPEGLVRDEARTEYLEGKGIRVMRFDNRQVLVETEAVLSAIWEVLGTPSPQPSPRGRGGSIDC